MWNRESGKVALDVSMLGGASKGKAKQKEQKSGIILERWTLQARSVTRVTVLAHADD